MQIDKITFNDLSVFQAEEEFSIFHKLNFTKTAGGKEWLRRFFSEPHHDLNRILGTQDIIKALIAHIDDWPPDITNGTVLMIEKFFEYPLDPVSQSHNVLGTYTYRFLHSHDYSMIKFSIRHFADFYRGLKKLSALFSTIELPRQVGFYIERINKVLLEEPLSKLAATNLGDTFTAQEYLYFTHNVRTRYRSDTMEMIDIFSRLDAWYSMATAVKTFNLQFPVFKDDEQPFLKAEGLYHILLQQPVAYDMVMRPEENFLFLTGANMAGKSTLIKAVGSSVFLAHIGMGVPAKEMELTLFDGLLTNINVVDNISKGESYFFNEVQRIKNTIYKINDGKKWLVLIDELFKGTNVQDAMKCSYAVIKGLIKIKNSVFILSTHLYELGEELKEFPNICFKYFETTVTEDQLEFSYQLKNGISNDRIGYVILKREKVVEMLEKL